MYESEKLDEAEYFLGRMNRTKKDPRAFRCNLSAFLSAARSVLQLAYKEASGKGGQAWYDSQVTGNSVLEFFRDRRNLNVHTIPVNPIKEFQLHIEESLYVTIDAVTTIKTWVSNKNVLSPDAENMRETSARHSRRQGSSSWILWLSLLPR
jgi:hypothetical protein